MATKKRKSRKPKRARRQKPGDIICQDGKPYLVTKTRGGHHTQVVGIADAGQVLNIIHDVGGGDRYDVNTSEALEAMIIAGELL